MNILLKLFLTFAKIGLIGFGGGMAILPLIYESVILFEAIDGDEFANLFAISQATPGPLAVNAATFAGFEAAGVSGAAAATLGVAVPSFILVAVSSRFINRNKESVLIKGALEGVRPVSVGMIMAGFIIMGKTTLLSEDFQQVVAVTQLMEIIKPVQIIMAIAAFVLAKKFKIKAFTIIIIMGILGAFLCKGAII